MSFLCLLSSLLCTTVKQLLRRYNFVSHPISNDSIFVPSYLPVIPCHKIPPSHPFILPPAIEKCGFYTQNHVIHRFFAHFSPVKQSNMNRFRNGFHSRIALGQLYNIAAQSLSRHKLRCIKIIIETFLDDKWFACVSSVVFEAKSIWISRDVLARRAEQFDTTHDVLGQKLAKLENCIFRSARDRFSKRLLS